MTVHTSETRAWQNVVRGVGRAWPVWRWRDLGVVVACSGGADSVALLRALNELRKGDAATDVANPAPDAHGSAPDSRGFASEPDSFASDPQGFLIAAHYNHALRGEQSDADEDFVRRLASDLGVDFEAGRATSIATDEATLRCQRSGFLTQVAHRRGARYVVTAHSADDNVETVLHHLMRGTGPAGIAGIGSPRDIDQDLVLVRPMLTIRRQAIRDGLAEIEQLWCEDVSNLDTRYRRNWIRHRLIPLIESEYPEAVAAMGRAIEGQRQWRAFIDAHAARWLESVYQSRRPVSLRRDRSADPAVILAAIQLLWVESGWPRGAMTRDHWARLTQTLRTDRRERYCLPGQIEVVARGEHVTIARKVPTREA